MAKFYGRVGYVHTEVTAPGVRSEVATERLYKGDLLRNVRRLQSAGEVNSSVTISNEVSIVADPYALENFHAIRYVVFNNSKWAVNMVTVQYPRLVLTLGEIYNGPTEDRITDAP